jgi:small subunit ribosomal protein S9
MADLVQYYGTGRRKSAVARVFLRPGSGNFKVNGKGYDEYFVTAEQRAAAVKMGIARALLEFNIELRKTLKADGLLSRDARIKERKKYGQKGARARFQFSKR